MLEAVAVEQLRFRSPIKRRTLPAQVGPERDQYYRAQMCCGPCDSRRVQDKVSVR